MGFTNFKIRKTTPAASQPEWLAVSSAVGRMVNTWAGRFDVAAFAAPGAGEGKPAFFNPYTSEVEINVELCFGAGTDPAEVADLDQRERQYEWPRATGAVFHEALHARFSRWDLSVAQHTLSPAEFNALVLLEEGRIEALGLREFPRNAPFLRTMALDIVVDDMRELFAESNTTAAAGAAALTLARVDAGSLNSEDVAAIGEIIELKLGADRVAKLREIWLAAQSHVDHENAAGLYDLARRWVSVVREAAEENGEPGPGESGEAGESGEGMSGSDGFGSDMLSSEFIGALKEALEEAADMASIAAYGDLDDMQTTESWEQEVRDKNSAAKDKRDAQNVANDVFGKGTADVHNTASHSALVTTRKPSGSERAAAVQVARALEKAKYRDRDAHEVNSIVPPGRLRTRAAVQSAALRSKGLMTTAEPWRRTVRKHTDDPTLSIGVMVDISGSMGAAMEPMAVTAWVLSEAVRRVQGKAAMVYYGNDVFPTLKTGQHLDEVRVWSAPDSTEKFGKAFKAVNGQLNLSWGTGARMLVIVSDGCYTAAERQAARLALAECMQTGVAVLWLAFKGHGYEAASICNGSNAVLLEIGTDPAAAAMEIGQAAARALESATAAV